MSIVVSLGYFYIITLFNFFFFFNICKHLESQAKVFIGSMFIYIAGLLSQWPLILSHSLHPSITVALNQLESHVNISSTHFKF